MFILKHIYLCLFILNTFNKSGRFSRTGRNVMADKSGLAVNAGQQQ